MGFWLYMTATSLLIPVIMLAVGYAFGKGAPKKINHIYGYRTKRSMQSRDTWEFAHKYCGKLWRRYGLIMLVITAAVMLFTVGKSQNTVGAAALVMCIFCVAVIFVTVFQTESALKKKFDQEGNLR